MQPTWILGFTDDAQKELSSSFDRSANGFLKDSSADQQPDDLLHIQNGITATLQSNDRLTPSNHWQDVRHLTLILPEAKPYSPGDVVTIYPRNFPVDVDQFIQLMRWSSIADEPLHFVPTSTQEITSYPPPPIPAGTNFTLRGLLTNHLDIMSIPRRSFFSHLAHYTSDPFHIERLQEFTNPEYIDELYDYTTRPRRSILEVLDEFTSVKIPWQKICSVIPLLRGRQFSIASGGDLKAPQCTSNQQANTTQVDLLVAIVKYKTIIKRIRQGVCTRYIASLKPGQNITVTLQKGGLNPRKADVDKPVVMVGPGTGVAPMRSLIYERMKWRKESSPQQTHDSGINDTLFFGCRNAEQDYFFREEWQYLASKGQLNVFAAFSRDQVHT